ncbi:MAG TPA: tetratricopeptide repeat protein [Allosphingosinicella sp.]|jgi:Flp pilus assembly protein TadD
MSKVGLKFAVSALAMGSTMVACSPSAQAFRPNAASARAPKSEQQATAFYAQAQAAVQKNALAEALPLAERAVALSPRDVGYRMLLADLYLKNGRFQSAETTFGDVLQLDPGNVRASLSLALSRIGNGRVAAALDDLDRISGTAPAADVGLAYALAGQPQRAIELLEPAARAPGASGRIRQNLALSYAIAGDWQKARITAAQDVSPADLAGRLQHWASLAQPSAPHAQVASLFGVTPVEDAGQPVHLALAQPQPSAATYAAAAPVAVEVQAAPEPAPAPQPVQVASAAPEIPQWVSERSVEAAPAPEPQAEIVESKPVYAEAVQALVTPQPAVMAPARPKLESRLSKLELPRAAQPSKPRPSVGTGTGRFAVQLGAFGSAAGVERAWAQAYKRYGFAGRTPLSTTVKLPKGVFHRLSVGGFGSHAEASRVCTTVRAKGGACFVRAVAGDAPTQWASRYGASRRG